MARLLRRIETIVPRRAAEFGGKAKNLAALSRAGFPVPAAYALSGTASVDHFEATLRDSQHPLELIVSRDWTSAELKRAAKRVREHPLDASLVRALRDARTSLLAEGAEALAVRSSSTLEDQQTTSAAGLHDTFLNVRNEDALLDAVRQCWASLFHPRVVAYLRRYNLGAPAIGVVIQALVPADAAGVMFTVNPLTGDAGELVINAAYGLGSSIVDGSVSPDTWRIDKSTGTPRDRVIGEKARRAQVNAAGEIEYEDIAEQDANVLCLSEAIVDELVSMGLRIEEHFGGPRDVEFAIRDSSLYVLQARPVTTTLAPGTRRWQKRGRDKIDRSKIVWSNINVGEALPGVATPLTWSILSKFSELGFRRAFGSLGCTVPRDAELVGSFRGRIYLNLTEFMGILSQVPGLRPRTLLALGGGGMADEIEAELEPRSPVAFLARLPLTAARFARENFRIGERVRDFEEIFEAERSRLGRLDPRVLPPAGLDKMLLDIDRLLDESGAIMLTAYGNLLATVVTLVGVLRLLAREESEALQRDLLTGLADLDSAAPGLSLWHIAEMARAEPAAQEAILEGDATKLRIASLPVGPTRRALRNFLEAHGHRGTREAEIAEPRWREDPTLLFATLQVHLRRGEMPAGSRPIDIERKQRLVRERAEERLMSRLPMAAQPSLRHLISLVQRFMRLRERLRGYVTEVLGLFRVVAIDASRRIAVREPAAGDNAAFYLTVDELHRVLRGDRDTYASRIQQRRRQLERDRALPDPPDTFVGYPPPVAEPRSDIDLLRGLAASGGRCEGTARLLHGPADAAAFQAGEILVASCADVGWSPLFLAAGAVVTDLGGPLSHASIVLREYAVPAVVNVKIGTRVIKTGDRLVVDGDRGEVRILQSAVASAGDVDEARR